MRAITLVLVGFVVLVNAEQKTNGQTIDLHEFNYVRLLYSNLAPMPLMMPPDWHAVIGYDIEYACSNTTVEDCSWELWLKPMVVTKKVDPLPSIDGHIENVIEDYDIVGTIEFQSRVQIDGEPVSAIEREFEVAEFNYVEFEDIPIGDIISEQQPKITFTMYFEREADGAGARAVQFTSGGGTLLAFEREGVLEDSYLIPEGGAGIEKFTVTVNRAEAEDGWYPLLISYDGTPWDYEYVFLDPN